ncbi:ATPase, T2SS/T4P/T4SS family [Pyrococcus yayanosii]|uniref:Type II secretion system protein n=1 Tax=Pyrococcus yayanosii (strain CH1 / JCM 16557) TaxID=529709 RepID=F8AEN4_PYRYC|nr:ATPase, T2SS/T4P/T4SS family [Pyrococcus yayanosii]AEH24714.1 type II secretion system protein [Pyrococcus yayanosii CH1]
MEKKEKKKKSTSWIDEILSGDNLSLEAILGKGERPKEKPAEKDKASLPDLSLGALLTKESAPREDTPSPLAFLKGGGGPKLEDILKKPSEEPKKVREQPALVDMGIQDILGTRARKPSVYSGEIKVLDVYGNVRILKVKGEPIPIYEIKMPELSKEEERLLKMVRDRAIVEIQIDPESIPNLEERRRVFLREVRKMVKEMAPTLSEGRVELLSELVVQSMIGYGKLDPLVRDDNLEEIMVIGTNRPVYVWHRRFSMCKTNIVFENDREILNIIERIAREVGRRIDQQSPLLDARLPDGSRVNATIPPISLDGPTLTIRKFKKDPLTIIDLIKYGTLNPEVAAFLWLLVDGLGVKPANILVAGGTGSGKTTTLNSIAMFIPPSERVISIEDTAELQLPIEHWVRLETRPPNVEGKGEITMDDLVKNTLRMRPDRIIVGEVRGPEARTMFTAMNTGHDGALLGDEPIQLSDGGVIEIGRLAEEFFQDGEIHREGDFEWVDVSERGILVKSFNKETFKIEDKPVTRVWRRRYRGRMLRIRTKTGKEITLTPDHPVYIIKNGIVEINAEKLRVGDYIALSQKAGESLDVIPNIGELIREIRRSAGLTQEELASLLGLSGSTIEAYERNVCSPSRRRVKELAKILQRSELELLADADVYWDLVVEIEEINVDDYVYDLTVADNHTYIAGKFGGFIVSNCMGTIHANSARETIVRLESPPMNVPRIMIPALDIIIMQVRYHSRKKGTIRRITEIAEVSGIEGESVQLNKLYKYDPAKDELVSTGVPSRFLNTLSYHTGMSVEELKIEIEKRKLILEWMIERGIRGIDQVGANIREFYVDEEEFLKKIQRESTIEMSRRVQEFV